MIPDTDIIENFLKGSGQKINKTSSAVQLKHIPTGIVVKCQETRSRSQNRKIARRILGERIEEMELGDESRVVKKREEKTKRKKSAEKKRRRKYRELERAKDGEALEVDGDYGGGLIEGVNNDVDGKQYAEDAKKANNTSMSS
jgi:peptide chain release factor